MPQEESDEDEEMLVGDDLESEVKQEMDKVDVVSPI